MQRLTLAILVAATLAVIPCSAGKGPGKGRGKGKGRSHSTQVNVQISAGFFSPHDRDVIHGYFAQPKHKNKFPPGLAKRGSLPPGLQKQLRRKGHLPPGLEKKISPLPYELEHRLPRLEPGLHRGFIDGKAIIYNAKTRAIIDIFSVL